MEKVIDTLNYQQLSDDEIAFIHNNRRYPLTWSRVKLFWPVIPLLFILIRVIYVSVFRLGFERAYQLSFMENIFIFLVSTVAFIFLFQLCYNAYKSINFTPMNYSGGAHQLQQLLITYLQEEQYVYQNHNGSKQVFYLISYHSKQVPSGYDVMLIIVHHHGYLFNVHAFNDAGSLVVRRNRNNMEKFIQQFERYLSKNSQFDPTALR